MLFNHFAPSVLLGLTSLASLSTASALKNFRRASESDMTLYCYGSFANGAAIFYADGYAYFGGGPNSSLNATVETPITFTVDTSDTSVAWTIQPNSSTVSFNSTKSMYIVPTTGSFSAVGFAASTDTLPTGGVSTGFAFFGTNVAYAATESDYRLRFWGANTSTSGVYQLYWNAAAMSLPEGVFPVTVKTTHPVSLSA